MRPRRPIVKPQIRVKNIPEENGVRFLGLCYTDDNYIEIDKRQSDREMLNTYTHELLHAFFPSLSEERVTKTADIIADVLWKRGYRSGYSPPKQKAKK